MFNCRYGLFRYKLMDTNIQETVCWWNRTIRDAVNHRTAPYNVGLLSGNMSEYKASCYALRRAVRAAKLDTGRELSHNFSSMTLDACGRD